MYSYFGPAHMTGHAVSVQNSAMMPYSRLLRHERHARGQPQAGAAATRGQRRAHFVKKVDRIDSEPLIHVLAVRECDGIM